MAYTETRYGVVNRQIKSERSWLEQQLQIRERYENATPLEYKIHQLEEKTKALVDLVSQRLQG